MTWGWIKIYADKHRKERQPETKNVVGYDVDN